VNADHHVVDNGAYQFVRHPLYTATSLAFVGVGAVSGDWIAITSARSHGRTRRSHRCRGGEVKRQHAADRPSRGATVSERRLATDRDSSGHELCWHHPEMWALLPESYGPPPEVPEWPVFLRGCLRYRESLDAQLPTAHRSDVEYDREH
jgi:hypothetical protein